MSDVVARLTNSAVSLGLLNICRLLPILVFTLIIGVVADLPDEEIARELDQAITKVRAMK